MKRRLRRRKRRLVLVGEPMGLFMAEAPGELEDVEHFTAAVAGAEYNLSLIHI